MTTYPGSGPGGLRRPRLTLAAIGLLSAFGIFATDLYLPAMPQVAADLDAPSVAAHATLSASFVGIAVGQLFWGPVADRVGRRTPILLGMGACVAATVLCATSPSVELLIAARVLQGFTGAAGVVAARAALRDLYQGAALARVLARLTIITGSAPIVSPVVGGLLLQFMSWRGTFVALAVVAAALVLFAAAAVPDTLPHEHRIRDRAHAAAAWMTVLGSRDFLVYGSVFALGVSTLFVHITFIPGVLQVERGIPDWAFGLLFAVNASGIIIGGQLSGLLVRRTAPTRLVLLGLAGSVLGSTVIVAATSLGLATIVLCAGLFVTVTSVGFVMPNATALALAPFSRGAGIASALLGTTQFIVGGLMPLAVSALFGSSGLVMGITMACTSAAGTVVMLIAHRRTH